MTQLPNIDFWKKEEKRLWELFEKLQNEVKKYGKPFSLETELEKECYTLQRFFTSRIHPTFFPSEMMGQLESEVGALGYCHTTGVKGWFEEREYKEKKELYKKQKECPSTKEKGERATVKRFYKNNGRSLKEGQITTPPVNSNVDVIVKEEDREVCYQVTLFRREEKALMRLREVSYTIEKENIKEDIIEAITNKELKSGNDIILLLYSLFPEEKFVEEAVTGLSINSSFKEIYIVMPDSNIPVKRPI